MLNKFSQITSLTIAGMLLVFSGVDTAYSKQGQAGTRASEKATEHSNKVFNLEEALQNRREVHQWLMSETVKRGLDTTISAAVSDQEKTAIDHSASGEVPVRVGLTKTLSKTISFTDLKSSRLNGRALARPDGAMRATTDGGYVFTTSVSSPGATAMRIEFAGFRMQGNAALYLYTEDGQVFGPYTGNGPHGDGRFWSHTLVGDYVILQLRHVGPVTDEDLRNTSFQITGIGHIRPKFLDGHCNRNADCVENATCGGEDTAVNDARNAIAHMQWISGPYIYMCTGGLLADTDSTTYIPYFLSANHCISRGKDARNLENFFQLTVACGTTNCDSVHTVRSSHPTELRTLGATIKSTGKASDYTLFELNEFAPEDSTYLGWNSDPVAYSNGDLLYRISHPGGAPQAYSEHRVDTSAGTCTSWPRGARIYSRDVLGATEGGSSGAPVLNAAGQVVGQLSGACGYNVNDQCDAVSNATVDGAFANYYSEISQFLDPSPVDCSPVDEICDDGLDNDCDGLIDDADDDCPVVGGDGFPLGASCESNDECASGKCKGRPNNLVCK